MASSSSSPNSPIDSNHNTTFVHADPSTFRSVVQRLTGRPSSGDVSPRRPVFKLHERRLTATKLVINLNNSNNASAAPLVQSPSYYPSARNHRNFKVVASPVSPLEYAAARGSPRTPKSPVEEEEERTAIANKGFYLHPNPPGGSDPPELLPLFPLHN